MGAAVKIKSDDQLFAVDTDGVTCSQVMYVVLRRVCRRLDNFEGDSKHSQTSTKPILSVFCRELTLSFVSLQA